VVTLIVFALLWFQSGRMSEVALQVVDQAYPAPEQSAALQAARVDARARLQEIRREGFGWGLAAVLLLLAGSLATAWIYISGLARTLRQLAQNARHIGRGDFEPQGWAQRDDELGELFEAFEGMRRQLRETTISRDYLDRVLKGMNEAVIVTDSAGIIARVNDAAADLLNYASHELIGKPVGDLVPAEFRDELTHSAHQAPREITYLTSDGRNVPVSYTASILADGELEVGRIFAAQNISERKRAEQRIRMLARVDSLTKLPNRMQFQHLLQRSIARSRRTGQYLALLYLDIDHFKDINDTFGHAAGDTSLEIFAKRIGDSKPEDAVAGRLSGDEFAVLIGGFDTMDGISTQLTATTEQLLRTIAEPFRVQGEEVFITASIGVAIYPRDADNAIDLIRNADAALYYAKSNGGNRFEFYSSDMNTEKVERLMLKSRLRRAFENDELLIRYQPKYNISTGRIEGAEALVRWDLPDRGLILPADFIPLAEETTLILQLGEWVLNKVCSDYRFWQRSVASAGRISVNLSLRQLRQRDFLENVKKIFRKHQVSPTCLELEITETTLMEDSARAVQILDGFYSMGLHLSIDDFGTGYSSLSALQQFPIGTLKIDQSFVRDVDIDPNDATLVSTIIKMGHSLNLGVVAEGVESEQQLKFLRDHNCDYAQGHLFGDPMSADDYLGLLLAQAEGTDQHRKLFA
jgi:diguanylate cyclase (GGDEF)-like protein/PAS domain S-box-containing protein